MALRRLFNSLKNSGISRMTEDKHRASTVYHVFIRKDVETGSRVIFMVYGEPKELYS